MTIRSTRLGPGTLELGSAPLDASCQLLNAVVEADYESGDPLKVLCGDEIPGTESWSYKISGEMVLDPNAGGVGEWSWTQKGTTQPFEFQPANGNGPTVTGSLRVIPLSIGGDEFGAVLTSDFEWEIVGEPVVTFPPAA